MQSLDPGKRALIALLAPGVVFAFFLLHGCGPSYQTIHEGDARFEHCYAMDEGASTAMDDKAKCWHDYRNTYAFGQSRDRLTYAARREHLLARSQELPTDEAMMEAAPGQVAVISNAPVPTNAFIPPPQMLASAPPPTSSSPPIIPAANFGPSRAADAGPPAFGLPPATPSPEAPGAACANRCAASWQACEKGCPAGTTAKSVCERCAKTHKTCMAACFR